MEIIENWRAVPGFGGKYEVSDIGRVRSFARSDSGSILKTFDDGHGYRALGFNYRSRYTMHKVHRLVALAFIPNPGNKKTINHINGVKADNRVCNLEWATHYENNEHALKTGLACQINGENNNAKHVIDRSTGKVYGCAKEAAQLLGVKYGTFKSWLQGRSKNKSTFSYLK